MGGVCKLAECVIPKSEENTAACSVVLEPFSPQTILTPEAPASHHPTDTSFPAPPAAHACMSVSNASSPPPSPGVRWHGP
jgi:hypothetical protein